MPALVLPPIPVPGGEDERTLQAIQAGLERVVAAITATPPYGPSGALYVSPAALSTTNVVPHRLGRKPRGWLVTRCTGAVNDLYEVANSATDQFVTLNSAAGGQLVEIWFF